MYIDLWNIHVCSYYFCVCFRIIARDTLTEAEGVGNVVTLVRDDDVDVIFGNPSSTSKCTGPKIILLFSCSNQLSVDFQLLLKLK